MCRHNKDEVSALGMIPKFCSAGQDVAALMAAMCDNLSTVLAAFCLLVTYLRIYDNLSIWVLIFVIFKVCMVH